MQSSHFHSWPSSHLRLARHLDLAVALAAILIAAFTLFTIPALAQVESGVIGGTVTDESGAVIPNASVTVTNVGSNVKRATVTSGAGSYSVPGLAPGNYQVSIASGQFKTYTANVEITVGGHVTLDAKLSVSANVTQVEVLAEGGTAVNTQTQEMSQIVDTQQLVGLPSLTRNPYDFVALSGNVSNGDASNSGASTSAVATNTNNQNTNLRGVGFNINGQRSTGTEILLDGVENLQLFNDQIGTFVPLDSVQEYRIATSNFEAQFGRASGGVVNVTTKTGTNSLHGTAWEYNRLSAYTSNTETNSQTGVPKGTFTRNQFGFDVGGPIVKNKLFGFGSTEWIRVRSGASLLSGVPTPQFLAAAAPNIQDFFNQYSGGKKFNFAKTFTAAEIYGASGTPVPAGLDPTTPMMGLASYIAPTNAGGGLPGNTYNIVARADYNHGDRTQMFFRFVYYHEVDQAGTQSVSPYSQYNVGATAKNQAYLFSLSHQFSPSLVSATKLGFSRFNLFNSYDTSLQNTPSLAVSPNAVVPGTGTAILLPGFYSANPSASGGLPFGGPQNQPQINEDLTWMKGRHSMQFGAQLIYVQMNQAYGAFAQAPEQLGSDQAGGLTNLFTGDLFQFEAAADPKGALPCVKNPYTKKLTPTATCSLTLPTGSPSFARSYRYRDWAVYAQDSFRMTPRFTFNYGVRYEYYGVQHNNNQNLDSNFYYNPSLSIPERMRTGQVFTVPHSPIGKLWNPSYGTVAPRVGFALDIFGDGRNSIRGGYGISYEKNFGNVTFNVIQNPPNYAVIVFNNVRVTNDNLGPLAGSAAPLSSPCYPAVCLPPTSLRHIDQNIRTAQTQFWSLAYEHQMTRSAFVSLQYVGARGIHLYDIKNYNGAGSGNFALGDPYTDPVTGKSALTRLNPQYSNINNRGSEGDSIYHGANAQFQANDLHHSGLSVVANYTYAHALDDLSTTFGSADSNTNFNLGYTDPFNPSLDRGNSDLDVRNRLALAPIWATPFFKNQANLMGEVLGGWQVAGIYTVHSGTPFSYYDLTNNVTGYNSARYTPLGAVTRHTYSSIPSGVSGGGLNSYTIGLLPAANSWSNPALGGISDWGPWPSNMIARNSFRGPGYWNFDMQVSKTFPIHEQMNLEFRAEGFNIFNHHNLYLQQTLFDVSSSTDPVSGLPRIIASKGGIGNNGGANDERRFGQFALKFNF
jgi:outer membrane receptor protein involved in Fe transport